MPIEDFNIVLEDQSGKKVQMGSETDQRYDIVWFQSIREMFMGCNPMFEVRFERFV